MSTVDSWYTCGRTKQEGEDRGWDSGMKAEGSHYRELGSKRGWFEVQTKEYEVALNVAE